MTDLSGRIAIVTGGTRGLGLFIATELAAAGAIVITASRKADAAPLPTSAEPGDVLRAQLDVTDATAVTKLVDATVERLGRLDIAVANAGVTRSATVARTTDHDWDAVLQVNLYGTFHLLRAALGPMRAQEHGRLLAISSVMATHPARGTGPYAASKAGTEALVRTIAAENARHGITATAIAPGILDTGMARNLMADDDLWKRYGPHLASGRPTEARAVAKLICFLCGPHGPAINASTIPADGGLSLWT
jgi:3-oxoacyl-[acyl-carrier protein] reductase